MLATSTYFRIWYSLLLEIVAVQPANCVQVLSSWERATEMVQHREHLLHDLERFELEASNPHRFFYKGCL